MATALEIVKAGGIPESIYSVMDSSALNEMAHALDKSFRVPITDKVKAEVVYYEPKKGGKPGMFLSITTGGRGGNFDRLCDGKELTAEGKTRAAELLTEVANKAADLLVALSQ